MDGANKIVNNAITKILAAPIKERTFVIISVTPLMAFVIIGRVVIMMTSVPIAHKFLRTGRSAHCASVMCDMFSAYPSIVYFNTSYCVNFVRRRQCTRWHSL